MERSRKWKFKRGTTILLLKFALFLTKNLFTASFFFCWWKKLNLSLITLFPLSGHQCFNLICNLSCILPTVRYRSTSKRSRMVLLVFPILFYFSTMVIKRKKIYGRVSRNTTTTNDTTTATDSKEKLKTSPTHPRFLYVCTISWKYIWILDLLKHFPYVAD